MEQNQEAISRRGALFRVAEVASIIPLAGIAISSTSKQDNHYSLGLDQAMLPERPNQPEISNVTTLLERSSSASQAAENLEQVYRSAYHESRQVPTIKIDGDGNVGVGTATEFYWDIPNGLPEQDRVERLQLETNELSSKILDLTAEGLLDLEKLREISVKAARGDKLSGKIITGLIYAGEIALLLSYEEILAYHRASSNRTNYRQELVESQTEAQHTRRGFLKIGAALAGLGGAFFANNAVEQRLDTGRDRLQSARDESLEMKDWTDEDAIINYFGQPISQLRDKSAARLKVLEAVSLDTVEEPSVQDAFRRARAAENALLESLRDCSEAEGKEELGYLCLSRSVTDCLQNANDSEGRIAGLRGALETLGVGAAMAAVVGIGEVLNSRFPEEDSREKYS